MRSQELYALNAIGQAGRLPHKKKYLLWDGHPARPVLLLDQKKYLLWDGHPARTVLLLDQKKYLLWDGHPARPVLFLQGIA